MNHWPRRFRLTGGGLGKVAHRRIMAVIDRRIVAQVACYDISISFSTLRRSPDESTSRQIKRMKARCVSFSVYRVKSGRVAAACAISRKKYRASRRDTSSWGFDKSLAKRGADRSTIGGERGRSNRSDPRLDLRGRISASVYIREVSGEFRNDHRRHGVTSGGGNFPESAARLGSRRVARESISCFRLFYVWCRTCFSGFVDGGGLLKSLITGAGNRRPPEPGRLARGVIFP